MDRLTGQEDYEELSNEPAFSKLVKEWRAYRNTGLEPSEIIMHRAYLKGYEQYCKGKTPDEIMQSFAELDRYRSLGTVEDFQRLVTAKNGGRLVELPCKVGDMVYALNFVDGEPDGDIEEKTIYSFLIRKDGRVFLKSDPWDGGICYADELGQIVGEPFGTGCWLTREEAEKKLEEGKGE